MRQLTSGVYQLELGVANAYLIRGSGALTLVDTGVVHSFGRLAGELVKLKLKPRDLEHIIVTHAHFDHAGGLAAIQAASGAGVWAHRLDAPYIRTEAEAPRPPVASLSVWERLVGRLIQGPQPVGPVHHELEGGERLLELHRGLEVVHLPGHSPGQIGLWFPNEHLLLGGDVVTHFVPWRLTLPLAAYTPDLEEAKRSIRRVVALGVRSLGVGHGAALLGDADVYLKRLARRLTGLGPQVGQA